MAERIDTKQTKSDQGDQGGQGGQASRDQGDRAGRGRRDQASEAELLARLPEASASERGDIARELGRPLLGEEENPNSIPLDASNSSAYGRRRRVTDALDRDQAEQELKEATAEGSVNPPRQGTAEVLRNG